MKIYLASIYIIIIVTGCSSLIPLQPNYFTSQSRVGLVLNINKIQSTASSSSYGFGLIGALISNAAIPRTKYDEALESIGPDVDPSEKVKQLYLDSFSKKGKQIEFVDIAIDPKELKEFSAPTGTGKKYFPKDLREFREKFNIDELMIVSVSYGIYAHYSYGIETSRYGRTYLHPEIIDLRDNSMVYKDNTRSRIRISGEWKVPPGYDNLKRGIVESTDNAILLQKAKY